MSPKADNQDVISTAEVEQNAARMSARVPLAFWIELKQQELIAAAAPIPG